MKKEQTEWQDDGTVLSLPFWAGYKAQCHEPNSTAEYFHQAPPDSPPCTLAGLGKAHRSGLMSDDPLVNLSLCEIVMYNSSTCTPIWLYNLCIRSSARDHNLGNGSVRTSTLYSSLLWTSIWQGFSYSRNINKFTFIAMTNSRHSFVALMIKCKLCLPEQLQLC